MKSSLKPALGFALAGAFVIFLFAKLGLWIHIAESCDVFDRVGDIVYKGELSLAGQPFYGSLSLGPLADYLTALPLFIFKKVEAIYLFISILWLVSVILFFIVAKRYFSHRVAFWATFIYFSSIVTMHFMILPWNDSYLSPFLPIYFYFTMEGRYKQRCRLFTYILIGVMAQLHILTLTLVPTSWVFWRLYGKLRTPIMIHLLGFLIIFIFNLPSVFYQTDEGAEVIKEAFVSMLHNLNVNALSKLFLKSLLALLFSILWIAPPLIIVVPLSIRKLKMMPTREKFNVLANLIAFSICAFLCLLAASFAGKPFWFYYLFYGFPFLAIVIGIFIKTVLENYEKVGRAAIGLTIPTILLGAFISYGLMYYLFSVPARSIQNQLYLAKRLSTWINENSIFPVHIVEKTYLALPPSILKYSRNGVELNARLIALIEDLGLKLPEDFEYGIQHSDTCLPSLIKASGLQLPSKGEPKRIKILEIRKWEEGNFKSKAFSEDLGNCSERWEYKGAVFYICAQAADSR